MRELVFLLEEDSAKALLETVLPRLLDPSIAARLIAFEGKQDLERQLVRRLKGYLNPRARFLVMRDQDSAPDCRVVKQRLLHLCHDAGRHAVSLVRIACRELETMYLADLQAVEKALNLTGLTQHQKAARFRRPDRLESPSHELTKITGRRYQKVSGSYQIGMHLDLSNERSASFKHLIAGIRKLEAELLSLPE